MTAEAAVRWGAAELDRAGLSEPRREARLLLRAVANVDAVLHPERVLEPDCAATYVAAIGRRCSREPFAYIVGRRFFGHAEIEVDRRVLVPRPETELLVERGGLRAPQSACVADLCTGSGAIAVALAVERTDICIDAGDISVPALEVARCNVDRHGLADRVSLWVGDLWAALPVEHLGRYDLCTCNPPYVDAADFSQLEPEVREWEPRVALVADEGWRSLYGRLAAGARRGLRPGGWLLAEIGIGQADAVAAIYAEQGLRQVEVHRDLAGIPRVVEGRWPG